MMTGPQLGSHLLGRIRDRFSRVQLVGSGAVTAAGADGTFSVFMPQNPPGMAIHEAQQPLPFSFFEILNQPSPTIFFYDMGSINGVPWKVNGQVPTQQPSGFIALPLAGRDIYAVATVTTQAGNFSADATPYYLFSSLSIDQLDIRVTSSGSVPGHTASGVNLRDPAHTGTYTFHAHLGRYDASGNEAPPYSSDDEDSSRYDAWVAAQEVADMPFQSSAYGWGHQEAILSPGAYRRFSILDLYLS